VASLSPVLVVMLLRPFSPTVWSQLLPLSPFWRAGPPLSPKWLPFPQDPHTLPPHCLLQYHCQDIHRRHIIIARHRVSLPGLPYQAHYHCQTQSIIARIFITVTLPLPGTEYHCQAHYIIARRFISGTLSLLAAEYHC
jgi:hypothetical protein